MDLIAPYHRLIEWIVVSSDMSPTILHVHVGLVLYVGAQFFIRTRRGSGKALQIVIAAELVNEVMDRVYFGDWRWADTGSDFLATLFWPTVLLLVSQHRRKRWQIDESRRQDARRMAHDPDHFFARFGLFRAGS